MWKGFIRIILKHLSKFLLKIFLKYKVRIVFIKFTITGSFMLDAQES